MSWRGCHEARVCHRSSAGRAPAGPRLRPARSQPRRPRGGFRESAAETGLVFEHSIGASGYYFLPEIMGAGVGLLDYDSDGDLDVYLLQGAPLDPSKPALFPAPAKAGNRLFRNETVPAGKLAFTDVSDASGLGDEGYGMGVAVGDYDNDGDADLYVTNFGPNALYRNEGDGTFANATTPGLDDGRWSTSASWFDYDADGDLDLFFANYVDFTVRNNKPCFDATGARDYCAPTVYRPAPDKLFRNDDGRFTDVSVAAGLGRAYGNGLGVAAADLNGDGLADLAVANDGTANQIWINNGDGTFSDEALMAGAAYNADGAAEAGMGVASADFDLRRRRRPVHDAPGARDQHALSQRWPRAIPRRDQPLRAGGGEHGVHWLRHALVRLRSRRPPRPVRRQRRGHHRGETARPALSLRAAQPVVPIHG